LDSVEEAEELFKSGKASLVLVVGPGFRKELIAYGTAPVQLLADASDPNTARTVVSYATAVISSFQQQALGGGSVPYRITPVVKLLYNPTMKGAYNFVPGTLGLILMLICAMMTSVSIAREKELGTMEVLLVSPVRPLTMIIAKVIPYFVLSVVDFVLICLISVFVLDVPIAGSLLWLVIVSLTYICLALALGILISSVVSSQLVALLISGMAMIVPVMFLSGMMFPIETMPVVFQWLSKILPASWYISAVRKLMIMGLGFEAIRSDLAVLAGMTLLLALVATKKHKARLDG
jgi:ABC-2 type transport system permease protein